MNLAGRALIEALGQLADLRIAVFRDWPYLYTGDAAYERRYLEAYATSDRAVVIGARLSNGRLVGAATGAPMIDHAAEFAAPFRVHGYDPERIYYFGESVLLPGWRGRGIGHAFFDGREAAAREHGFDFASFCAVQRPMDHPLRPANYRPLDMFWRARGYAPIAGITADYPWADIGAGGAEIHHQMQFWMRELSSAHPSN